jgi:hypothetical protein
LRTIRIALITGAIIAAISVLGAWSTSSRAPSPASSSSASTSASPGACGPWSQQGSAAATAVVSTRTIRNCLEVGTDWVIATTGGSSDAANLGILRCGGNSTCAGGQADPAAFARWHWFQPAGIAGGITIFSADGSTLLLDAGGHELTFSLTTDSFAAATGALS